MAEGYVHGNGQEKGFGLQNGISPITRVVPYEKVAGIIAKNHPDSLRKVLVSYVLLGKEGLDSYSYSDAAREAEHLISVPDLRIGAGSVDFSYGFQPSLIGTVLERFSGLGVHLRRSDDGRNVRVSFENYDKMDESERLEAVAEDAGFGFTIKSAGLRLGFKPDESGEFALDLTRMLSVNITYGMNGSLKALENAVPTEGRSLDLDLRLGLDYTARMMFNPANGIGNIHSVDGNVIRGTALADAQAPQVVIEYVSDKGKPAPATEISPERSRDLMLLRDFEDDQVRKKERFFRQNS